MSFGCVNVEDNIIGLYYAILWIYTEHNFLFVDLEFIKSDWTRNKQQIAITLSVVWVFNFSPHPPWQCTNARPTLTALPASSFRGSTPPSVLSAHVRRCDRRGYFRSISFFEIRFIWNVHPVPLCTAIITSFKPAKIVSFNMCWRSLGEKAVIYPSKDLKQLLMTLTTVNYWFIYVNRIRLFFTQHLQR